MFSIPTRPESDADLDRNAAWYRVAVARSTRRGVGPIALLVITAMVAAVVAIALAFGVVAVSQVRIRPQVISKGIGTPVPAPSPAPRPTAPVVMPQGGDSFAK